MTRAGAAGLHAALPRHVPRGVAPARDELLGLRRYGAEMRRLLAIDIERRSGPRAPTVRGHGMDYAESRPYTPGDDVRRIDWRVTARTGRAHTKLFERERGNDLFCIVDQRARMRFGTRAAFKSVAAAHLAALTGWAAAEGGDRFGGLVAGQRVQSIRVGAAEDAAPALCAALAAEADEAPSSDTTTLEPLAVRAASEGAVGTRFVLVSDFADAEHVLEAAAKALHARGDLVLVWVFDAMDVRLPPPARYPLTDGHEHLVLDTAPPAVRAAHAFEFAARRKRLARLAAQPGTSCHAVCTGEPLFDALERPVAEPFPAARAQVANAHGARAPA